jgi:serine protease Do
MKARSLLAGSVLLTIGLYSGISYAQNPGSILSALDDATVSVAQTTGKAVVSISSEHVTKIPAVRRYYYNGRGGNDEMLRKFFDEYFGQMPEREYRQTGLGSGVIINDQGYILTNNHVVEGAEKLTVILPDGRQFTGEVKGTDARADLAVIKINASDLPVAVLGDSDNLKIGQWVVAIGNPFGFALQNPEPTVTVGVVSALHRTLGRAVAADKDYNDLIQTDAAINPGNSGGPLVNLKGEVIGINVAIFSTTGGSQGIGFAIPVNSAKRVLSRLIEGKKIAYGWLGVTVQDLTDDLAKYFGLADKSGILVGKVIKDGPADKGGLKDGDIITRFNGQAVKDVRALLQKVSQIEVGKKAAVSVLRNNKPLSLSIEIGERPQDNNIEVQAAQGPEAPITESWRGIKAENLTPENIQRFKIEDPGGVVVVSVDPKSPADLAGISAGDVIQEINRMKVSNLSEYQKIIKGVRGDVLLGVSRGYVILKESSENSKQR